MMLAQRHPSASLMGRARTGLKHLERFMIG
jgi:hypothetical protein